MKFQKSLYLFMSAVLGALLFLILQRIALFIFYYLIGMGIIQGGLTYPEILFLDYFTLTLALMMGVWYGIWLGLHWYQKVYEERSHMGVVHNIAKGLGLHNRQKNLDAKIVHVKEKLSQDLWQLEDLAKVSLEKAPEPAAKVRRVVRKRAPKKLTA